MFLKTWFYLDFNEVKPVISSYAENVKMYNVYQTVINIYNGRASINHLPSLCFYTKLKTLQITKLC